MSISELKTDIAASLYYCPATEDELLSRDFLKNYSINSISRLLFILERDNATYWSNNKLHVYKKWAMKNLNNYDIDFRSDRQKLIDSLTDVGRAFYGV